MCIRNASSKYDCMELRSVANAVLYSSDLSLGQRHSFPQQLRYLPADGSKMSPTLTIATCQMGLL